MCQSCSSEHSKVYCYTCSAFLCEKCFIATYLVDFSHLAIFSMFWNGNKDPCPEPHNGSTVLYCLECEQVCSRL
jgi:hypothetical protein